VAYDPNPAPAGGQIVFFTFNYAAMEPTARQALVQNAATYLMAIEVGNSSIAGQVFLQGQVDHSGVLVELQPGGQSAITGPDGLFSFPDLFAGSYQLLASKEGWATAAADIDLADGEDLTGLELILAPMAIETLCRAPATPIPDVQAIDDTLYVGLDAQLSDIEVYLDISHTYIGDLVVELISPEGTTVRLHNRTGGSANDIVGWYPSELTPYGNLANFVGEQVGGNWVLHVSDHAGSDTGTLNEWCLKLMYPQVIAGLNERDALPQVLTLEGNYPNPFNPKTQIAFGLPRAAEVDLAVYDIRGRRVATLVRQTLTAGRHTVIWLGSDDAGRQVSSGIYFYRLRADDESLTGKMMLLK
jgi:subtilisin-like proprotein convertase family protein